MVIKLSGPSRISSKQPDKLVIFLHGVGADGNDLLGLSQELGLSNAVFLSPNAPFPYDMFPIGYQWFSLSNRSEESLYQGIQTALPILKAYIDENLAKYKLHYKNLILIGFSQGSMMAMQLAPRLPEACLAVVAFSGALVNPKALAEEALSKPAICLIHGEEDQVVSSTQHRLSARALKAIQIPFEEHLIKELGHSINLKALDIAKNFLIKSLPI
jgi:phospholipase/carboxylesterase